MRKILILALALLTMVGLAAPVGAAKGGKPGKPGPVGVTIDANLYWVNAAGDTIYYTITVTSSQAITDAMVELSVNDDVATLFSGTLEEGSSLVLEYAYFVVALPDGDIEALVTVWNGTEALASDSTSVVVEPVAKCLFAGTDTSLTMTAHAGGVCWYDFDPGYWEIVAEPDYTIAGRNPGMTIRDHMPGNWCMVGETVTEGGSRTRPASITRYVDLPTENPFGYGEWFEVGVCGLGGHGVCTDEDCFFPIGNPATFVLWAPAGTVTANWLADAPPNH